MLTIFALILRDSLLYKYLIFPQCATKWQKFQMLWIVFLQVYCVITPDQRVYHAQVNKIKQRK